MTKHSMKNWSVLLSWGRTHSGQPSNAHALRFNVTRKDGPTMTNDELGLMMDCYILGDLGETELRRRMREHGLDDYSIDALVNELKLLAEAKREVA
jgi:hypothetical protein